MTLAIAHKEGNTAVLDVLREVKPKFSPDAVVADFITVLKGYGVASLTGDRWGASLCANTSRRLASNTKSAPA